MRKKKTEGTWVGVRMTSNKPVRKLAEQLEYEYKYSKPWIILQKDGNERKYRTIKQAYDYLYSKKRKKRNKQREEGIPTVHAAK